MQERLKAREYWLFTQLPDAPKGEVMFAETTPAFSTCKAKQKPTNLNGLPLGDIPVIYYDDKLD